MDAGHTRVLPAPHAQQTRIGAVNGAREIAPRAGTGLRSRARAFLVALPPRKRAIAGGAALVVIGGIVALALRSGDGTSCPKVVALDESVRAFSFGHLDAQVECGQNVKFGFRAAPSRRVLLHYQAAGAVEGASLSVRLNGTHLAWARPAQGGEDQVLPLPDRLVRTDGANVISFVQTEADRPWSIAKV